ncbi:translation initiation factor IF-2 [Streptomyces sp. e14]|nr:translation initiation factor IF-2 [Streptomyces sp. e14]
MVIVTVRAVNAERDGGGGRPERYEGDFETHLTLEPDGGEGGAERVRAWAARHGLKYTHILLDRGRTPNQPMLTWQGRGTLPAQLAEARRRADRLRGDGFRVIRVKSPESPVWTLVPRGGGGPPTAVRTASRELSLAWKLLWLHTDSRGDGGARGKDLYDAVVLAELDGVDLSPRLLRKVLRGAPDSFSLAEPAGWDVDWAEFRNRNPWVTGTARHWLDRLVRALGPVLGEDLR